MRTIRPAVKWTADAVGLVQLVYWRNFDGMENPQKVVRRVRIEQNTLDQCRAYFPGISLQKLIAKALENELLRKQKKRLRRAF